MNINCEEQEILDSAWIAEFKKLETEYNDFYKEIPKVINGYNLYINKSNTLASVITNQISLNKKGGIDKDTIIAMIQKNKKAIPNKRLELQTILKYNFTLEPESLLHVIENKFMNNNYLTEIDKLDDLVFKETIHFFNELNAIYFIYKEIPHTKHSTTKKIYLKTRIKSNKHTTRCKRA